MKVKQSYIIYILTVILLIFFSCGGNNNKVLSSKKMEDLVYDLTLTESILETKYIVDYQNKQQYFDNIYKKHHTTEDIFDNSLEYYSHKPKQMQAIYDSVQVRIDALKKDVDEYKFHPEDKIKGELEALDTFEIFQFEDRYHFSATPPKDSLKFVVDDQSIFAVEDQFIIYCEMSVDNWSDKTDTLKDTEIELKITYSDYSQKILSSKIYADKSKYKYTFSPVPNKKFRTSRIEFNLFNSNEIIKELTIDSICAIRIYNSKKYPLPKIQQKKNMYNILENNNNEKTLTNKKTKSLKYKIKNNIKINETSKINTVKKK